MLKEERIQPVDTDIDFDMIDEGEELSTVETPDVSPEIQAMLSKFSEQSKNYVDHRLLKIKDDMKRQNELNDERFAEMEKTINHHTSLLTDIANATPISVQQIPAQIKSGAEEAHSTGMSSKPKSNPVGNILDTTLGTVGGVLHGVVDTTAFLLESIVDLATLGKARRSPNQ